MSALDKVLELLAAQQGQAQQAGNNLAKTAAQPINRGYLNQGQSAMDGLINPTANQNRALLTASLAMMGHDPTKMPGETLSRGIGNGLQLLDTLREDDQQRKLAGAVAQAETANNAFDQTRNSIGSAISAQNAQTQARFAENEANQGPKQKVTDDIAEYNLAAEQGFSGSFEDWMNRKENHKAKLTAEATAQEQEVAAQEAAAYNAGEIARIDNLFSTMGDITSLLDQGAGGVTNAMYGFLDFTDEGALRTFYATLDSNLAFDRLQKMRTDPANKTGGALGQVSNIELGLLKSSIAQLNPKADPDVQRRQLAKVMKHYMAVRDTALGRPPAVDVTSSNYKDRITEESGKFYLETANGRTEVRPAQSLEAIMNQGAVEQDEVEGILSGLGI